MFTYKQSITTHINVVAGKKVMNSYLFTNINEVNINIYVSKRICQKTCIILKDNIGIKSSYVKVNKNSDVYTFVIETKNFNTLDQIRTFVFRKIKDIYTFINFNHNIESKITEELYRALS